jgi:hypothetical protein
MNDARACISTLFLAALTAALTLCGCGARGGTLTPTGVTVPASTPGSPSSAPVQPIDFRHDVHAGQLKIDCLYCHTYAARSPVANVPAVSVCMNCHRLVGGELSPLVNAPSDPAELQKVRDYYKAQIALVRGFSERQQSIPWASVYRLPDHAYFNHKRHVKAGLVCQACHGPVETMQRVYKYSSLKMGWCVRCHKANARNVRFASSIDCYTCHR